MTDDKIAVEPKPRRQLWLALAPVAIFAALAALFAKGLTNDDPNRIPSVLLGKPVPEFNLPAVDDLTADGQQLPGLKTADLKTGRVSVINVWASWCAPCRVEHPFLMQLAEHKDIHLAGINYKDKPENARRFLGALGNPFARVGADQKGSAAVDWGVYGVPETFIVDGDGVIRYKWIGPLTERALNEELIPRIRSTQAKSGS